MHLFSAECTSSFEFKSKLVCTMGLKERRFAKQFAEEQFPALEAKIKEAIGFEVPLEIAWETLFEEQFLHLYNDTILKFISFHLLKPLKLLVKIR